MVDMGSAGLPLADLRVYLNDCMAGVSGFKHIRCPHQMTITIRVDGALLLAE